MTTNQLCNEKIFEILCKLKRICDENSINMFLYGETALEAYRSGKMSDYATTCIDICDVNKLIKLIKEQNDRELAVETMLDNGRYPVFELRVYNPKTVDFNFNSFLKYKNNCLHVTVRIVEHIPDSKLTNRLTYVRYGFYKDNNRVLTKEIDYNKEKFAKKIGIKYMQIKEKLSSPEKVSAGYFNMLIKKCSGKTNKVQIGNIKFKPDMFSKFTTVTINDVEFNIPKNTEKYLASLLGLGWKTKEVTVFEEGKNYQRFRDTTFSWDEFKGSLDDIDFDEYFKLANEYNLSRTIIQEYNGIVRGYYDILDRTDMRFKLWQQYEPKKDYIMQLFVNDDFDGLKEVLNDYIVELGKFADLGLGLCFDTEIFDVTMKVLEREGKGEYIKVFTDLVPEVHKKPLRIKDYRGEYIN